MADECLFLPPGFRFHPTDEEIISHYLTEKVANQSFTAVAIGEVELNTCEPWDLPKKAKMGEKAWYFFSQKDRKYPTGMRTNRATEAGYWKATGKDREIYKGKGRVLVGMKKTLVFYMGRAPKGEKTNWVMHEFRIEGTSCYSTSLPQASKEEWVVCRVFHKNEGIKKNPVTGPSSVIMGTPVIEQQEMNTIRNQEGPSYFFSQIPPRNPHFSHSARSAVGRELLYSASSSSSDFMGRYCKVEQASTSSMASQSQEKGPGNVDWHAEISSYSHSSDGTPLDLENMWEYY